MAVYVETGPKRVYAGAVDWPGWDRGGRDETSALQSLVDAGPRYRAAIGTLASELRLPEDARDLEVVERPRGNATTDFGVPAAGPSADGAAVGRVDLERLVGILRGSWRAFDAAVEAATGVELRKGPRGGGRDLGRIVEHVTGAERSYLYALGASRAELKDAPDDAPGPWRELVVAVLAMRARGEPVDLGRRTAAVWTPRYFVRRAAWHVLDHAWEIEDRAARP